MVQLSSLSLGPVTLICYVISGWMCSVVSSFQLNYTLDCVRLKYFSPFKTWSVICFRVFRKILIDNSLDSIWSKPKEQMFLSSYVFTSYVLWVVFITCHGSLQTLQVCHFTASLVHTGSRKHETRSCLSDSLSRKTSEHMWNGMWSTYKYTLC